MQMEVLVVADSRGRGLQPILDRGNEGKIVKVLAMGGAGSQIAAIRALHSIKRDKPELVILMTGICDLTWRDRRTHLTKLRSSSVNECVENVMGPLRAAYDIMESEGGVRPSIATLTGLDLADYNYKGRKHMSEDEYKQYSETVKERHKDQGTLNEATIEINRRITALNKGHGIPTTWLSTVVHTYYRGVHHHNYKRLRDGCHPDEGTKNSWCSQIRKTIKRLQEI